MNAAGLKSGRVPGHIAEMARVELKHIALKPAQPLAGWQGWVTVVSTLVFLGSLLLTELRLCGWQGRLANATSTDGWILLACAVSTLASLSRQLPAQNVIFSAALIAGSTGLAEFVNGQAAVPLGPLTFQQGNIGRFVVGSLPWSLPVLWVVILLNARGVARLILRSRRTAPHYGFWVLGLTVLLVVVFEICFQPYATQVKGYWTWKATKLPIDWYTTPVTYFFGAAVLTLLVLLFVTPGLINKNPAPKPASFHPLLIWETLSLLFLTGAASKGLTAAWIICCIQMAAVAAFSVSGGRKRSGGV